MKSLAWIPAPSSEQSRLRLDGKSILETTKKTLKEAGLDEVRVLDFPYQGSLAELAKEAEGGMLWMTELLPAASPEALRYFMSFERPGPGARVAVLKSKLAPLIWISPESTRRLREEKWGFRELLTELPVQKLDIWDPGSFKRIWCEADWIEAGAIMADRKAYGPIFIRSIRDFAHMPLHIRAHCDAVAMVASHLADALKAKGHNIDPNLVKSGAALHDICRLLPRHDRAGADLFQRMGYGDLAEIVERHMDLSAEDVEALNEAALVFYADKITEETCRVSPRERYQRALDRFPPSTEVGQHIMRNLQTALDIEEALRDWLGEDFDLSLR